MAKKKEVEDLIGRVFGRWTVISRAPDRYDKRGRRIIYWNCRCECGTEREVSQNTLKNGSKSCGCLQREIVREISKKNRQPFKHSIGEVVKTNAGSITVTGQIRSKGNRKCYFYICNVCGYQCDEKHVIDEKTLDNGHGCSICGGGSAVQIGINDVGTTAPWMLPYFKNINDAYTRSVGNRDVIDMICPHCKFEFPKILANAYKQGINCPKCGDGYSYPEKFMISVLTQLDIEFKFQLTHTTFEWCKEYKYDFYLPKYNLIIETNGEQHYSNRGAFKSTTLEEQKEIDNNKKQLALNNGVDYIVIDCRNSNKEWMENNIKLELDTILDLSNVDFFKCVEDATSNIVKKICDYYMNNNKPSTIELSKIFPVSYSTIGIYLKKGAELGWCNYDPKEALKISRKKNKNTKPLRAWYKNEYLGRFECATDLVKFALEKYNIKLLANRICEVCNGKGNSTKEFKCEYIN